MGEGDDGLRLLDVLLVGERRCVDHDVREAGLDGGNLVIELGAVVEVERHGHGSLLGELLHDGDNLGQMGVLANLARSHLDDDGGALLGRRLDAGANHFDVDAVHRHDAVVVLIGIVED